MSGTLVEDGPPEVRYSSVLVPFDGSEHSATALPVARVLARAFDCGVTVMSASSSGREADELQHRAAELVDPERLRMVEGEPAAAVEQVASELQPCLICMSTRGRGRAAALGSIATEVLRRTRQPIVAVGPNFAGGGPMLGPPPLLACVDGSQESEQVLPVALGWARRLGMGVTFATVVEPVPPPLDSGGIGGGGRRDAQAELTGLSERWQRYEVSVNAQVIEDPISPAQGLNRFMAQHPAGLVALTSRARSGLRRAVLGSVAGAVVRTCPVPVLVVPTNENRF